MSDNISPGKWNFTSLLVAVGVVSLFLGCVSTTKKAPNITKEVTPEIIRAVGFAGKRSHSDLRTGMILVAIGMATFLLGGMVPEDDAQSVLGGIAMFPLFIGIAYLGFWFMISRKDPE